MLKAQLYLMALYFNWIAIYIGAHCSTFVKIFFFFIANLLRVTVYHFAAIPAFFAAAKSECRGYQGNKYKLFHTSNLTQNNLNRQIP